MLTQSDDGRSWVSPRERGLFFFFLKKKFLQSKYSLLHDTGPLSPRFPVNDPIHFSGLVPIFILRGLLQEAGHTILQLHGQTHFFSMLLLCSRSEKSVGR